jgi:uncharacterized protein YbcI
MPSEDDQDVPVVAGEKLAAISNATVKLLAEYTGRGPTRARTTISGRWVFITLEDTLTKGERQLAANGHGDWVLQTRKRFQAVMQSELEAAVERHTGREVVAFMSDNHIDPDVAVEAFMLAPDGDPLAAAEVSGET